MTAAVATKYSNDAMIAQDPEFIAWMTRLEKILKAWGDKHCDGDHPYGAPLIQSTGLSCWHDLYVEELTPQEAFDPTAPIGKRSRST